MCYDTDDADDPDATDQTESTDASPTTVRHSWVQSGQPSVTLIEAVAAATDRTTTDLPPLQRSVDPDALDTLLTGESPSPVTVSFTYADTTVRVTGNGDIEIQIDGHPTDGEGK